MMGIESDVRGEKNAASYFVLVHESRSGSTYLGDLLGRHPDISVAPESDLFRSAWRWGLRGRHEIIDSPAKLADLLDCVFADEKQSMWNIDADQLYEDGKGIVPCGLDTIVKLILKSFGDKHHPGSRLFGIKRGGWNATHLCEIARLVPGISIINLLRDGRAVYASEKKAIHSRSGLPFQSRPVPAAWRWRRYAKAFEGCGSTGYEIRYEDLIRDPIASLAALLEYLGAGFAREDLAQMIEPHSSVFIPDYGRALHKNVGKRPLEERIDAWKEELNRSEIRSFERVAGDVLVRRGYALNCEPRPWDGWYRVMVDVQQRITRTFGQSRHATKQGR